MWRKIIERYNDLACFTAAGLLGGLERDRFRQIHRATLVNVAAIAAVERLDAERVQVLLRGCSAKLPASRSFTHLFRE